MKKHVLKLFCCFAVLFSCNKEAIDDGPTTGEENVDSNFTLMTNIDDPLLAIYENEGLKTFYYGDRDENGIPTAIDLVEYARPGDTTLIALNSTGLPENIRTGNGVQIRLDWLSDQSASVVMLSPDGEQQINFLVDPLGQTKQLPGTNLKSSRLNRKIQAQSQLDSQSHLTELDYVKSSANGNVRINVSSCFEPTDVQRADVIVLSETTGLFKGRFPAVKGPNPGEFFSTIPSSVANEIEVKEDICEPLARAFNLTCDVATKTLFLDAFCTALSAAIASSGIAAPAAVPFFAACESAILDLRFFCLFNNLNNGLADEQPTISDEIIKALCSSPKINRTFTESLKIYAVASGGFLNGNGGSSAQSPREIVDGGGPYPNLNIDLGSQTAASSLFLNPSVPGDGQDYNVFIDLFCVYQNTKIEFSVVGTDGFTDSAVSFSSTPGLLPLKNERFSFSVPGAETGVRDNITVRITFPDGRTEVRNASLVFG